MATEEEGRQQKEKAKEKEDEKKQKISARLDERGNERKSSPVRDRSGAWREGYEE